MDCSIHVGEMRRLRPMYLGHGRPVWGSGDSALEEMNWLVRLAYWRGMGRAAASFPVTFLLPYAAAKEEREKRAREQRGRWVCGNVLRCVTHSSRATLVHG